MPTYSYCCKSCSLEFEVFAYIKDYISNPKCIRCESNNTERHYIKDITTQSASVKKHDSELKTIGDLANRNRDKMSDDQKTYLYNKHNEYKDNSTPKPLPKGMNRISKKPKIKWT